MKRLNDKEIISLLESLLHSGDLKLKISVKEDCWEFLATSTLTYRGRKLFSVKNSKTKHD